MGYKSVIIRAGNQRTAMLQEWAALEPDGGTDADVFVRLGEPTGMAYWNRAIDLLEANFIVDTGRTKVATLTGQERRLCRITPLGLKALGDASSGGSFTVKVPKPLTARELLGELTTVVEELLNSPVFSSHSKTFTSDLHGEGVECRLCAVQEVLDLVHSSK